MDNKDLDDELRRVIPFIKSWKAFYLFVAGELAILILLFYLFSNYYA